MKQAIETLLRGVKEGKVAVDEAMNALAMLPFNDLGFAKIDTHRALRTGYPEVIYGEGKSVDQLLAITANILKTGENILITRSNEAAYEAVRSLAANAVFNPLARTIVIKMRECPAADGFVAIVAAGTSDLGVVEEAYETLQILGCAAKKIVDVGVAGIHRLFAHIDEIRAAKAVIVVAGMEGALASVVGGLVDKPVIAVPTSVGYGASFHGLSALLSMLNSCAAGVSVVNIDNGFGAAYCANKISRA
ncbi:1-(5-phosphoribosyl)-5-amino-4-imidazole-carboxylate carboxylase [Campylobacterota bacterium]|nr:1-(5-phosphoribosyl)-5-amino-4-imidazole-carboxylate carboxylase [Campylobacterota bacterium]